MTADSVVFELPQEVIAAIVEGGKPVHLIFGDVVFVIPAAAFAGINQDLTVSVAPVSDKATAPGSDYQPIGPVYDITATTASGRVTFATQIQLGLAYNDGDLGSTPSWKLGIYRRNDSTGQWEFVGGIVDSANNMVYANLNSFSQYTIMAYDKTFDDIVGHWARLDIEHMAAKHVVRGMTDTTFVPEGAVTRAQFAALLVRALNIPVAASGQPTFQDLGTNHWAFAEVEAAVRAGLVRGVGNNRFEPDRPINRQEMAAMLIRAAEWAGNELDSGDTQTVLAAYSDANAIADWAADAVAAALRSNLMIGRTASEFVPHGTATRAEAATVIKRLMNLLGLL